MLVPAIEPQQGVAVLLAAAVGLQQAAAQQKAAQAAGAGGMAHNQALKWQGFLSVEARNEALTKIFEGWALCCCGLAACMTTAGCGWACC